MNNIVRVVYKADKSVSVIHPAWKSQKPNETDEQFLIRTFNTVMQKTGLAGLEYEDVDKSVLPSRDTRDAWEGDKTDGLKVNQAKHQNKLDKVNKEKLIQEEMRKLAEDSLKQKGKI